MLEKMSDFFEARLDGYDEHMLNDIESATKFYPFTAKQLPIAESCRILDLGFASVEVLCNWGATYTLKAIKQNTAHGG